VKSGTEVIKHTTIMCVEVINGRGDDNKFAVIAEKYNMGRILCFSNKSFTKLK
jgi:hypothetical protein